MNDTIVTSEVQNFLDSFGGNYVAAYGAIVADQERRVLALRPSTNAESRKAAYAKAVKILDPKVLSSMEQTVKGFIPLVKENAEITALTGDLTPEDAEALMVEVLEVKRLKEIADSRYAEIRKRVFSALTEEFAANGEDFPEMVAGSIDVPNLGLKFTREGGARKDPELDEAALQALVGDEVWEKVTTVELIPAQEVRTVDMDLFLQAARSNPALLESLREALIVGDFRSSSFHQRAMDVEG